jgi:hypothetical protein
MRVLAGLDEGLARRPIIGGKIGFGLVRHYR